VVSCRQHDEGGGAGAAARKTQYRKTGTDKVGNWTCDKYEGYEGTVKTSEVCTAAAGYQKTTFGGGRGR